ncbi:hypothetical protein F8A90_02285 [Cobetia sp. cqz5-12]|uniref:hypothetical protein n=1 Tax=Cobetia sp. cqz5-12 TaxID=2609415 RepID=UPI0019054CA3|nr:hypothetical protein [Cobetia sp. cqz5-12]QQK63087.1 hypothetical protein F8A90_02285 [Cobetia sp. cqz5-12]
MSLPFSRWTRALSRTLACRSTGKPASRFTAIAARSRFGAPIKAAALAFAMSGIGVSLPTQAAWQLVPDSSGATATLTSQGSQGNVEHVHHLNGLSGTVGDDGRMSIPLSVGQTDLLDKVGELPPWLSGVSQMRLATLTLNLDPLAIAALETGQTMRMQVPFSATDGNRTHRETLPLEVTRQDATHLTFINADPISLDSAEVARNQVGSTLLNLLGYGKLVGDIPVTLQGEMVDQ